MGIKIRISEGLELNAEDFIESAVGVLGKRGGGKTGGLKVMMEELVKVGLPFVAFDPVGVMWGIKSSLDGKSAGLPVLVVGGSHGDLRLDRHAGGQFATGIVQANISCIVDMSEEPKAAYREFVKDFCLKLFAINETSRLVILEEGPELVPQKIRPEGAETFDAVERLVSRGRNKGIGVVMVSQRAATINKDVLTQVDALMIFGLTSPQDRKALTEWVEAWDQQGRLKEFEEGLAGLQRQEAWFWAPTAFKKGGIFQKIRVRDFKTFHPDKTHLRRSGLLEQKPVTTDVSKVVAKLGAELERFSKHKAEVASIPKLQTRIRQLEKDLETAKSRQPASGLSSRELKREIEKAKAPLEVENQDLKRHLRFARAKLQTVGTVFRRMGEVLEDIKGDGAVEPLNRSVPKYISTQVHKRKGTAPASHIPLSHIPASKPRIVAKEPVLDANEGTEIRLTKAHLKVLSALAKLHGIGIARPSKNQVALWSGYSPTSGGYFNYLGQLRSAALVEYGGDRTMFLTEEGKKLVDSMQESPEIPSTIEDLREQVFRLVGESRTRILKVLIEADQESISKQELAEQAGFSPTSGGYFNYLGNLRSMGLIDYVGGGVVAAEVLFP